MPRFHTSETKGENEKPGGFDGVKTWKLSDDHKDGYLWTDGERFLVSLAGSSTSPVDMGKGLLAMIGNEVEEIEKQHNEGKALVEAETE